MLLIMCAACGPIHCFELKSFQQRAGGYKKTNGLISLFPWVRSRLLTAPHVLCAVGEWGGYSGGPYLCDLSGDFGEDEGLGVVEGAGEVYARGHGVAAAAELLGDPADVDSALAAQRTAEAAVG